MMGGFFGMALAARLARGHPVDVATGELFTEEQDFEIAGPLPLRWRRCWISSSSLGASNNGPLGEGWHHNLDMSLVPLPDGSRFVARLSDGRLVTFRRPLRWRASVNAAERLLLFTDGEAFWITDYDGQRFEFGPADELSGIHPLERIADPNGNTIALERLDGRLVTIVDSANRSYAVENDAAGRITGIDGPHPDREGERMRLIAYEYDSAGNLVAVANARGAVFRYAYDNHLIVEERRPGRLTFSFVWDDLARGRQARCVNTWGQRPSDGAPQVYKAQLEYDPVARMTVVTDGEGGTTRYRWTAPGLVEEETDPLDAVTLRSYDAAGRLTALTAADGQISRQMYDVFGRLIFKSSPEGLVALRYVAEGPGTMPLGRAARVTLPGGGTQQFDYDDRGNLVRQTDATGRTVQYLRDSRGLLLAARDAEGTAWRCAWSESGDLIVEGTDRGDRRRYTHDYLGRVISVQLGNDTPLRLTLDAVGNLVEAIRADGGRVVMEYDGEDQVISHLDAIGRQTRWEYDGLPFPIARHRADGYTIRYCYDRELRLISVENAKGELYHLSYDKAGRLQQEEGSMAEASITA